MWLDTIRKNDKQEIIVILAVSILALGSILYSFYISKQLQNQEKAQVILWAKAVTEKAEILKTSNEIFQKLRDEERIKVEITSKSSQFIINEKETDNDKLSFYLDIIKLNSQIPIVYTDKDYRVVNSKNLTDKGPKIGATLSQKEYPSFFKYPPIDVRYGDKTDYLFYEDSKIYQELTRLILKSSDQFIDEITNNSSLLPIILVDEQEKLLHYGNIPPEIRKDTAEFLQYIQDIKQSGNPILIDIDPKHKKYLYYKNSSISKYIQWFPIVLYTTLGILFFIAYRAIRNARNFEKNQIWVGMSKETAHQLGTPISSLSAWLEMLEDHKINPHIEQTRVIEEMKHDVNRLALIADRFSKIGSKPKLEAVELNEFIAHCIQYLQTRTSSKIHFEMHLSDENLPVKVNKQLFEWVIENIVKNAVDAIGQEGKVTLSTSLKDHKIILDISDTGKGMHSYEYKKIFEPGYTTKKRGWGLGLSLCRRIIVEYFGGKIFVKSSEIQRGTTMRIILDSFLP